MPHVQRYEVIERIAVGGMAEVFLARAHGEHGFRKEVAIKRILPKLAESAAFEARFIAEAKTAVTLGHANIVQVFDFGRDDASLFIAMEYVRGANLAELLAAAANAHLPFPAILHIAISIAHGLELAHSRGVLHRDLSPSNVLLSTAGEVKIADFGIAKPLDDDHSTQKGPVGKWAYMAPEQARGERLDRRADIFALGVILHELLTTQRLFRRKHWEQTLDALLHEPIPTPSQLRADIPAELDAIVLKALDRDPAARYASAADLGRALSEACMSARIVHTPDDVAQLLAHYQLHGHVAHRARTASTASALEAPLRTLVRHDAPSTAPGDLTQWAIGTHDASVAGELTPPRPRRGRTAMIAVGLLAAATAVALAIGLQGGDEVPPAGTTPTTIAVADTDATSTTAAVTLDAIEPPIDLGAAGASEIGAAKPTVSDKPPVIGTSDKPRAKFGTINIQATPWAHVYVGGKLRGTTPLAGLRLPIGQHKITLVNPEIDVRRTVTVTVPHDEPYLFRLSD
jgi:serine/threonine-protein kinase